MARSIPLLLILTQLAVASASGAPRIDGCWYSGDGTGVNLTLTLERTGAYKLTWRGCMGVYGTAAGTWTQDGDTLHFAPTKETDMLKDHPVRILRVIRKDNEDALVSPEREADVKRRGADRYNSYGRTSCEPSGS